MSTLNDPALLEWADHQLLQLSVFLIPPSGTRKIEIEYLELLPAEGGLVGYRHPLASELAKDLPIDQLTVAVSASSTAELRAVYSPSHRISVDRPDNHHFVASYESSRNAGHDQLFFLSLLLDGGCRHRSQRSPLFCGPLGR